MVYPLIIVLLRSSAKKSPTLIKRKTKFELQILENCNSKAAQSECRSARSYRSARIVEWRSARSECRIVECRIVECHSEVF